MACIEKIYSVSALVGSNACNANCAFCAARELRSDARRDDAMPATFKSAIRLSARYGGWSLSLTSSGEPTCSPNAVTSALIDYQECASQGAYFPNVNLFTNGILLGDASFSSKWLPSWKQLGLTSVAVSVHAYTRNGQAAAYGIKEYPELGSIFKNVRDSGLQTRATILMRKGGIDNPELFCRCLQELRGMGVENITCWWIADTDGTYNQFTPSFINRMRIRAWLKRNGKLCHGHIWGGGVYDVDGMLVRITDYVTKHDPSKDYVRQLVVFQDGLVSYSWIKEGAICMKM